MVFVRKSLFIVLGAVLLCLPAAAFAEPLDSSEIDRAIADILNAPDLEPLPALPTDPIDAPRLSKDVASLDKELLVSIGHDTAVLDPNAPYEIFLDDTSLGTYTSDANGQLFVQVVLPTDIRPGPHRLKVTDQVSALIAQKTIKTHDASNI
jgi:hypothetical protein